MTVDTPVDLGRLVDNLIEEGSGQDPDELYGAFTMWTTSRGLDLYPAQDESLIEVFSGANLIVSTPTGSGKSLIALGAQVAAVASGRRTYYTAPIKALVSEKFFDLCAALGADRVGMLTGDASVNPQAPVICCTAEILANLALRQGAEVDVGQVVMDEFHFYSDPERGWAWQVPLLELAHTQFVLMSATLGDVTRFEKDLTRRTGNRTACVTSAERPVPLHHYYAMTPLHETITELLETGQAPVYIVHFTQAAALERAQALMSVPVASRAVRDRIADRIGAFRFSPGFGGTLSRLLRHGIGVHHAGMLPRYRRLVEQLAQAGLLTVVCGTDTLGVGINVPIRTVLLTALSKYDGNRFRQLNAREFHQIAGRAGRAGFDSAGTVIVQAPEHEIDNTRALAKAGDDPRKRRKVVRKKPPPGTVWWSRATFDRLVGADPEPLTSSLRISHAMVLNVLARPGDPFPALRHLLEDNDEPRPRQRRLILRTIAIVRALLAAGVAERVTDDEGGPVRLALAPGLQLDFALNQPLSPFALAAIELLDPQSPEYALDVVSVVEATLEDPRPVLYAQQKAARGEAVAAMKADGVPYEERMNRLEEITHPRPLAEMLDAALELYRQGHPWVADEELSPKSVVRELFELAMTFPEYIRHHGLARVEGLVLRYLADAFRALRQTVPEQAKTEELLDLQQWIGELVRQVDSSLLTEWEALRDGDVRPPDGQGTEVMPEEDSTVTGNPRAFRVLVRNALFRRVELAARRRWSELGDLDAGSGWDAGAWQEALEPYFDRYDEIGTGPDARGPALLLLDTGDGPGTRAGPGTWWVRQILDDPEADHDWGITAVVDLAASDADRAAVLHLTEVGPLPTAFDPAPVPPEDSERV
jgi:superfamily II RNA helicase